VTDFAPGDHVITCLSVFCGHCEHCLTGFPNRCENPETRRPSGDTPRLSLEDGTAVAQFTNLGSFAEQQLVHEHALVKVLDDIPLDRAALIGCAVITGVGAVWHTAKVQPGETVAVIGCGGIGLNCVQGARIAGAGHIIAIDRVPAKLALAEEFGATEVINAAEFDPVVTVLETTGGVHHAFEAIGLKVTAEQAFGMLRSGGTATIIGLLPPSEKVELPAFALFGERRIQGSRMGSNRFRVDMPRLVDLYLQGRLKLDELVAERIPMDRVNEGFATMKGGQSARSVIVFD